MNRPYHIVTGAAREPAAVIEQFCRTNGQILLPILVIYIDGQRFADHHILSAVGVVIYVTIPSVLASTI